MRILFLAILPLIFSTCTSSVSLKTVRFDRLFNDNSSKVWLIENYVLNDMNISPFELAEKELIIFHKNNHVDIVAVNSIGKKQTKKGKYYLDSENRLLQISFKDLEWNLSIRYITEDSMLLRTTDSNPELELKIIPFPEL